jgi:hypothetical protein
MLPALYNSSEYKEVPIKERRKAAWMARQKAMHHWQFWLSIAVLIACVLVGFLIDRTLIRSDSDGTLGVAIGFVLGLLNYRRILIKIGMPYYREILEKRGKS